MIEVEGVCLDDSEASNVQGTFLGNPYGASGPNPQHLHSPSNLLSDLCHHTMAAPLVFEMDLHLSYTIELASSECVSCRSHTPTCVIFW
jgi:hypothetical protein